MGGGPRPQLAQVVVTARLSGPARDFTVKVDVAASPPLPLLLPVDAWSAQPPSAANPPVSACRKSARGGVVLELPGLLNSSRPGQALRPRCVIHPGVTSNANNNMRLPSTPRPGPTGMSRCRFTASGMRHYKAYPIPKSAPPAPVHRHWTIRARHNTWRRRAKPRPQRRRLWPAPARCSLIRMMPSRDRRRGSAHLPRSLRQHGSVHARHPGDGRDQEVPREDTTTIELPDRQLLGPEQEGWLAEQLVTSVRNDSRWSVFGQQVMFAPQTEKGVRASNPDSWDGYRAARSRVFDMLERARWTPCVLTETCTARGRTICHAAVWLYDKRRQARSASSSRARP